MGFTLKIAMLLSGGVDSSVALHLLKKKHSSIKAFYLKIWLQNEFISLGDCPWEEDLFFVKQICKQENVPLEVISLQEEYWSLVVDYVLKEVKAGRTPNPDIYCNSLIKFDAFFKKIPASFDKVATGHYAKVSYESNQAKLMCAKDTLKDQTYFLAFLKATPT